MGAGLEALAFPVCRFASDVARHLPARRTNMDGFGQIDFKTYSSTLACTCDPDDKHSGYGLGKYQSCSSPEDFSGACEISSRLHFIVSLEF